MRPAVRRVAMTLAVGVSAVMLMPCGTHAQADEWSGWSAYWENDSFVLFGSSDDAFTNGVRLSITRHPNAPRSRVLDWVGGWLSGRRIFSRSDRAYDSTTAVIIGQNLFTPRVITDYEVDPSDRPFAGLLYVGVRADFTERADEELDPETFETRPKDFQWLRQHALEVDIGVLGPAAGGEPVQSSVHAAVRTHRVPKGWPSQIGNTLAIAAEYSVRDKIGWDFFDAIPHAGALLGTTQIYPFLGFAMRLGLNMSGFPALVGRQTAIAASSRKGWELGVMVGAEGRYFVRNSFIQGSIFGGGDGIDLVRPVGDYRLGAWLRLQDWRLSYTFMRRSPEVAEPGPSEGLYDNYGSASLAYEPGPEVGGGLVDLLIDDVLGTVLDDFILEAGIGPDLYDEREPGVDQTHGMHVAVGRALWGALGDFDVAYERVGVGRELGPPAIPNGDHSDRFLVSNLATLRWRPGGGRVGPGELHVRGGVGRGSVELEITPGVPGDRAGPCPPGTAFEPGDLRYCTTSTDGTAYLLGLGYTLDWGRDLGFHSDLSWNHIALTSERRILALTFGIRWAPR